MMLLFLPFYA